ncbi:MAG: lasso peptide biosynthesis B2 protein [Wenzhouxiangella sp.]|nr:lasso peptide biosynthesis B2 protein [Wenzhouxiangella sp.]TVR94717.1 MAG: lasso peptide biosynthesis B2 protein [Wenzhouxiangellaceae bacterium]
MFLQYRQLSPQERRDAWAALLRLTIVRVSLLFGMGFTRRWLGGRAEPRPLNASRTELEHWRSRATALKRASRFVPGSHCLARSLALRWWMRSHGLNAEAVIGVRRDQARSESHAWVMLGQRPIDESDDILSRYIIIFPETVAESEC